MGANMVMTKLENVFVFMSAHTESKINTKPSLIIPHPCVEKFVVMDHMLIKISKFVLSNVLETFLTMIMIQIAV